MLRAGPAAGAGDEDRPDALRGPDDLAQAGLAAMAEDGAVLGADEAGAVGPAELLAEEAELGGRCWWRAIAPSPKADAAD